MNRMDPNELLAKLGGLIYRRPLSDIRDDGSIVDLNIAINVVILVLDFDTERAMSGIMDVFGNSTGKYIQETALAFRVIGALSCYKQLQVMIDIAESAGMTYKTIQDDRVVSGGASVTSWRREHGDKWRDAEELLSKLDDELNMDELYDALNDYVDKHYDELMYVYRKATQQVDSAEASTIAVPPSEPSGSPR